MKSPCIITCFVEPENIRIEDYNYDLPQERIAQFPLPERDRSKLLIYKDNSFHSDIFRNISGYLPAGSLLVFNETRVIQARLIFRKPTGARIEIFCLEPVIPYADLQLAFRQTATCKWKCYVGNAKRWKDEQIVQQVISGSDIYELRAVRERIEGDVYVVRFEWAPANLTFAEVLEHFGKTPLPPYISREATEDDRIRYQTIFARQDGSVAAPTAGLHFTENVMKELEKKNIETAKITLHVGAGTFKPVTSSLLKDHEMHGEQLSISKDLILKLRNKGKRNVTLVGTTSVRAVESLYWQGVKWLAAKPVNPVLDVRQWDPYAQPVKREISPEEALDAVLNTMESCGTDILSGSTSLLIAPGYNYRIPDAIVTNFHLPQSTLLLLVAAFIGDRWKETYSYALNHDYRFLSYGDSCLFFK